MCPAHVTEISEIPNPNLTIICICQHYSVLIRLGHIKLVFNFSSLPALLFVTASVF